VNIQASERLVSERPN